jgi:hypothetical protein
MSWQADHEKLLEALAGADGPLAALRKDAQERAATLHTLGVIAGLLQVAEQHLCALQAENRRLTERITALEAELRALRTEPSK